MKFAIINGEIYDSVRRMPSNSFYADCKQIEMQFECIGTVDAIWNDLSNVIERFRYLFYYGRHHYVWLLYITVY
jgi:hypothetical protein